MTAFPRRRRALAQAQIQAAVEAPPLHFDSPREGAPSLPSPDDRTHRRHVQPRNRFAPQRTGARNGPAYDAQRLRCQRRIRLHCTGRHPRFSPTRATKPRGVYPRQRRSGRAPSHGSSASPMMRKPQAPPPATGSIPRSRAPTMRCALTAPPHSTCASDTQPAPLYLS